MGQSRIVQDVEWSISDWKYITSELLHWAVDLSEEKLLLVNHHVFSTDLNLLGALGRKVLTTTVIYDPFEIASGVIESIWRIYVKKCYELHSEISNEDIINSVMRSERFSLKFRQKLSSLIDKIKI